MKQNLHKQKRFMSSKDLYFLPLIKEVKLNSKQPGSDQKIPAFKHKSIEQIIEKKENSCRAGQKYDSFTSCNKESKNTLNLYNKYESLPKIYMYRNRKQQSKLEELNSKALLKKHLQSQENEQTKIDDDGSYLKNKENSFNFNDMYYKDHFNKRLIEETQKIDFKLSYNYSEKGMLLSDEGKNDSDSSQRKISPPVKYIKIDTICQQSEETLRTLQKVPEFLMKLLEPQKHLSTI